jgi:methylmalonyl-CoA carboxyltransferase 12S subunit
MPTETVQEINMQTKIEELKKRRAETMLGGGADKLEKHRQSGKLTARERIAEMVDPDSFEETGLFAEHRATLFGMEGKSMPADGVVTGACRRVSTRSRAMARSSIRT